MADLGTAVGSLALPNPVMTASGTAGHGAELDAYVPLGDLGAVVTKSVSCRPWSGNPPPRIHPVGDSMINSVGLQGPSVDEWLSDDLPALRACGARVVASIWGRSVDDFAAAARSLATAPVSAVEVNVSCPNTERGGAMFAHDPEATARVITAVRHALGPAPVWAKLSPNTDRLVEVATAAIDAGADALTLVNTVLGMAIDTETRRPILGGVTGGMSGPALGPIAVRAVYECRRALPDAPIVGVGGVASARDVIELMLAGASAVQVGTATFADPRAPRRVLDDLDRWCARHGVGAIAELIGGAHG